MLTDEQELIRSAVREWAELNLAPIAQELDRHPRFPEELIPSLGEMGIMGMPYPTIDGGAGADYVSYTIAIEEISRVSASLATTVAAHVSLAIAPIANFGTEAQKMRYLPNMTSGEWLGAFALTEPTAGSDVANGKTTATRALIGGWVLNGSKIFITNAPYAQVYIVFANTEKGMSAFIVEKDAPGFSIGAQEHKMGIKASSTCPLYFDNCWIPEDALLGTEGMGFKIAMKTLDSGRLGVAAQAIGIAQAALEASISYAKERVQFGKPIATLPAIQAMIADMATEIEAARLLAYAAAAKMDAGLPFGTDTAMAKLYASEMATRVTGKAIQVHGGYGFTESYPVERYYRDAKITELYEGTSEIQRMVIARANLR